MPTGKKDLNPRGLMLSARRGRDAHARVLAATGALQAHIARSESFAEQLDQAVMRNNRRGILKLIKDEVGLPDDAKVKIVDLDPDRRIRIEVCIFGHCASITIEW
jgi:hypothetical protein